MSPRPIQDSSARLADVLRDFRATHGIRTLPMRSGSWEYLSGGSGDHTIAIVGGGGSTAESMFSVNVALEPQFRVVSVGIPPRVSTPEEIVEGVAAVLDAAGVQKAILLGHSLGGMVVQCFALHHPKRTAGLVLSNTGFYLGARGVLLPAAIRLAARVPVALLIRGVMSQMDRLLRNAEAADFWNQFYREELSQPGAGQRLKSQLALTGSLSRYFRRNPIHAGLAWTESTPVLIISSEDDRGFTREEIASLTGLYRRSETRTFPKGTGHLSFLTRPRDYVDAVRRFAAGVVT